MASLRLKIFSGMDRIFEHKFPPESCGNNVIVLTDHFTSLYCHFMDEIWNLIESKLYVINIRVNDIWRYYL